MIPCSVEKCIEIITDNNNKPQWSPTFDTGYVLDKISDHMRIEYTRMRKVVFRAQREYYVVTVINDSKPCDCEDGDSPGQRTWISASRSIETDDQPQDPNYVRTSVHMIGWQLEEVQPELTRATYCEELDTGDSFGFLSKTTTPTNANLPNKIKNYLTKI